MTFLENRNKSIAFKPEVMAAAHISKAQDDDSSPAIQALIDEVMFRVGPADHPLSQMQESQSASLMPHSVPWDKVHDPAISADVGVGSGYDQDVQDVLIVTDPPSPAKVVEAAGAEDIIALADYRRAHKRSRLECDEPDAPDFADTLLQLLDELVAQKVEEAVAQWADRMLAHEIEQIVGRKLEHDLSRKLKRRIAQKVEQSVTQALEHQSKANHVRDSEHCEVLQQSASHAASSQSAIAPSILESSSNQSADVPNGQKVFTAKDVGMAMHVSRSFGFDIDHAHISNCGKPMSAHKCMVIPPSIRWDSRHEPCVPFAFDWDAIPGCIDAHNDARRQGILHTRTDHTYYVHSLYKSKRTAVSIATIWNQAAPIQYQPVMKRNQHVAVFSIGTSDVGQPIRNSYVFEGWYQISAVALFSAYSQALWDALNDSMTHRNSTEVRNNASHAWAFVTLQPSLQHECPGRLSPPPAESNS